MTPIEQEAEELRWLAKGLAERAPQIRPALALAQSAFADRLAQASHPVEGERAAEQFARNLRSLWLRHAAAETSGVYRSPTEGQLDRLEHSSHDAFGYERDLQPETLEARCASFCPAPPAGWSVDHILFSSGQTAMTAALIALGAGQPMRLAHLGAYFETRALIDAMSSSGRRVDGNADYVAVIEPIYCDGRLHANSLPDAFERFGSARALIIDATLTGRDDGVAEQLGEMGAGGPGIVLRVSSGLKLFQAGLELANVGILSVHARDGSTDFASSLRRLRTLIGGGLHSVDAVALEAPWFLDADYIARYEAAVFAHNSALASAVAKAGERFGEIEPTGSAPFCAFQLAHDDGDAYDTLEREIAAATHERKLLLDKGGSFGFRGHRFEVVRPEDGEPSFLRVAMGRRGGWSCDGIIAMMADIAAR